ncbi:hypothetical protein BDR07DRAFT_1372832 [Suillus spraguei]|nr:hypothetical protein BDR07DRAFT_1372832 [Suillus spraguei]
MYDLDIGHVTRKEEEKQYLGGTMGYEGGTTKEPRGQQRVRKEGPPTSQGEGQQASREGPPMSQGGSTNESGKRDHQRRPRRKGHEGAREDEPEELPKRKEGSW